MRKRIGRHIIDGSECIVVVVVVAATAAVVVVVVVGSGGRQYSYEQALVCLCNREIVDASRGCTFHCKMANNRFFL